MCLYAKNCFAFCVFAALLNDSDCRLREECARLENTFSSERRLAFDILSILNNDTFVTFELFETALGVYIFAHAKVVEGCLFESV